MNSSQPNRCQRCGQAGICWPHTLTIIGQIDLCGECYWEYRRAIKPLQAYFEDRFPTSSAMPADHEDYRSKPK